MDSVYRNGGFRGKFREFKDPSVLSVVEGTPTRTDVVGAEYETYVTDINTYFVCDLVFPVNPTDGLIWETGGSGQGAWIGIRDSGATLRLRGGDGGSAISVSGAGVALAETADFPKDGEVHQLAWDFQISTGRVRIFIDGVLKAEGFATDGAFESNRASGGAPACFLTGPSANVPVGESTTACNLTDSGSGLRYFANAQIVTGGKYGGMWSMLPKYADTGNFALDDDGMKAANEIFTTKKYNFTPIEDQLGLYLDARNSVSYPGTGSTWYDLSGNDAHMTMYDNFSHNVDMVFPGNASAYGIANLSQISAANDFTVEIAVKFNSFQASRSWLAVMGGSGSSGQVHWIQSTSGSGQYGIWAGGQVAPQFALNKWHHITQRFYGSTLDLYLDGVLLGPVSATRNFADNSLRLAYRPISESYFNGSVSFVRVYGKKLTEAEVTYNYNHWLSS